MSRVTEELKPCPLCGGKAELWRAHPENPKLNAWVACADRCLVLTQEFESDEAAIAHWNTRTPDRSEAAITRAGEPVAVKGIRDCLEAIEYASGNCIKEHGQKTVNELAKVALSYLSALAAPADSAEPTDLTRWLRKASQAIYLATDGPVADEISPKLIEAADELEAMNGTLARQGAEIVRWRDRAASSEARCCSAISPCSWQRHNGMDSVCPTCTAAAHPAPASKKVVVSDWKEVARLAGVHGIRYRTNAALEAFLTAALAVSVPGMVRGALDDITAERQRQISAEGWTIDHDDSHSEGEMACAAGIYALIAGSGATDYRNAYQGYSLNDYLQAIIDHYWPWDRKWFKPTNRRRDLVKAGALIVAEIERLDRAASPALSNGERG
jgi:hypothetical protein